MAYKILLIEDDKQIREIISDMIPALSKDTMEILEAENGEIGLSLFYENDIDLVLLDIMLPGMDGFEICRELRRESIVPIIFLTAKGREEDKLYGYSCGCDDYVVKPFSLAELHVKMSALIKRAKGTILQEKLVCGNISLDPVRLVTEVEGVTVFLPPKEFAILKLLLENKNHVIPRDTLLIKIWGYDYDGGERVVDNHIKKLRKALGKAGSQIRTIITKGYMIE